MSVRAQLQSSPMVRGTWRGLDITTPEGVTVKFSIPSMGLRFLAFSADLFVMVVVQICASFFLVSVFDLAGGIFIQLLWFFLANLYFPICEYRWGATLGKRVCGIRVIERSGAPLGLEGVLARNFLRDVELWIPLALLAQDDLFAQGLPTWSSPISFLILICFSFFPCFNRRKLRIGDYIGGTVVVATPKPRLLADLAQRPKESRYSFTTEQLSVYGRIELQVLEDLLRRPKREVEKVTARVAYKVRKRIGWGEQTPISQNRDFLEAFYLAQREELERLLALGKARESKGVVTEKSRHKR